MEVEVRKCAHIKVNGTQCGSPALKTGTRCYFHEQAARRTRTSIMHRPAVLPLLEDANAIQVALMDVIHDLRQDYIDIKVAGKLLYALQIASANLKRMDLNREDSITDLPPDVKLPAPIGVPRAGYMKLPYEGIPDPTLESVSTSPAPSTVAPASRRPSPSTAADASTSTSTPSTSHPEQSEGTHASRPHKRASGSSTSALHISPEPHLSLTSVQRKLAAAKKGNVRAARELFEFAGIMPKPNPGGAGL
jgi:hypothetical protein